MKKYILILPALIALGACSPETQNISSAESAELVTAQLSNTDFQNAAQLMLNDMLTNELSGDKTFVMEVAQVRNDTLQRINTADLTDYIRRELRRTGRITVTNLGENASVETSRNLANSAIMDQSTVMQNGTVTAADMSLFGRISQREFIVSGQKKIEYLFSLSLTNLRTGIEVWSNQEVITKLTDKNTRTW